MTAFRGILSLQPAPLLNLGVRGVLVRSVGWSCESMKPPSGGLCIRGSRWALGDQRVARTHGARRDEQWDDIEDFLSTPTSYW
jgi:hypothetical protein